MWGGDDGERLRRCTLPCKDIPLNNEDMSFTCKGMSFYDSAMHVSDGHSAERSRR